MNTKKNKIIGGIALLVVLLVLALRWFGFIPQGNPESVPPALVLPSAPSSTSPTPPSSSPAPASKPLSPAEIQKRDEDQFRYQSHVLELLYLTPIVFYGKVIDQT